jgi:hypothetical protein
MAVISARYRIYKQAVSISSDRWRRRAKTRALSGGILVKSILSGVGVFLAFACYGAFAAGDPIPVGTLKQGSLANPQLTKDAMLGVAGKVAVLGCDKPGSFVPYLVAMPKGEIGARHWKEKWLVSGCGKHYPIDIEFSEDGPDAANYTIQNE